MNYQKIYNSIIEKAKSENRKKYRGVYYEYHHIVPKCLGGSNEKINRVLLTAKEHYVCHKILYYLNTDNNKLAKAYFAMSSKMSDKRKLKITPREYEESRIAYSIAMTGENNHFYNKPRSEEHKEKIRQYNLGRKMSPESIKKQLETKNNKPQEEKDRINKKISKSLSGENHPLYGTHHSDEMKEKIRQGNLHKKRSEETKYKLKIAGTGKKRSEESKNNQKETIKNSGGVWNKGKTGIYSDESIKKQRQAKLGKKQSPESIEKREATKMNKSQEEKETTRQRQIEAQKGKPKNPASIAKRVETNRLKREARLMAEEEKIIEQEKRMMIF